jgi:hypothetical protein
MSYINEQGDFIILSRYRRRQVCVCLPSLCPTRVLLFSQSRRGYVDTQIYHGANESSTLGELSIAFNHVVLC